MRINIKNNADKKGFFMLKVLKCKHASSLIFFFLKIHVTGKKNLFNGSYYIKIFWIMFQTYSHKSRGRYDQICFAIHIIIFICYLMSSEGTLYLICTYIYTEWSYKIDYANTFLPRFHKLKMYKIKNEKFYELCAENKTERGSIKVSCAHSAQI